MAIEASSGRRPAPHLEAILRRIGERRTRAARRRNRLLVGAAKVLDCFACPFEEDDHVVRLGALGEKDLGPQGDGDKRTDRRISEGPHGSWFVSDADPAGPNAHTKVQRRLPNTRPPIMAPHEAALPAHEARRT
jgi:hypothetical protein